MALLARSWAGQGLESARRMTNAVENIVGRSLPQVLGSPQAYCIVVTDHAWAAEQWARANHLDKGDYIWAQSYKDLTGLTGHWPVYFAWTGEPKCLNEDFFYRRLMELSAGAPRLSRRYLDRET